MIRVVIDTNILIDYVNGYADWLGQALKIKTQAELILPTIVIAEYFTSQALENQHEVEVVNETFALFKKQDLTEEIAKVLGSILRRKTHLISVSLADLIIASTALHLDAELATNNKADFARIPNLKLFDPRKIKVPNWLI